MRDREDESTLTLNIADKALMAFLRVMIEIEVAESLEPFKYHKKFAQRFTLPFQVKMGFGLHIGWAIEGAIGSKYKIDASYLSPDVNMSARLEAATKQFGTPLLMSHWLYSSLSKPVQKFCRCIDAVTVKGSVDPMALYTVDITNAGLTTFSDFVDFSKLHPKQTEMGFYDKFEECVEAYFAGHWDLAKVHLEECLRLWPEDGPTMALKSVMKASHYECPLDWGGFRELTEK
jgi:hypothetical protein